MSQNFTTVKSITDNIQSVLQGLGIKFSRKTFEDEKTIPASLIPFGEVFYQGEEFEYNHGQRQGYATINYLLKVIIQDRDPIDLMRSTQKWVHAIRDALTVNALNISDLATSKFVSLITVENTVIENKIDTAVLGLTTKIRYRET